MADTSSVSEISMEAETPLEVTREQHLQLIPPVHPHHPQQKGVKSRLSSLIRRSSTSHNKPPPSSSRRTRVLRDTQSVNSDNATNQSLEGIQSLTSYVSHDTVKASNKTEKSQDASSSLKKKGGWTKLKRMMGVKTAPTPEDRTIQQSHSSDDTCETTKSTVFTTPKLKRLSSKPKRVRSLSQSSQNIEADQAMMDDSIGGRLDGIDLMSVGGAQMRYYYDEETHHEPLLEEKTGDPSISFVGDEFVLKPAQIVSHMLRRDPQEIFLDGFIPGVHDRWSVRIEESLPNPPGSEDGGSPATSTLKLWNSLWGPDPRPSNINRNDLDSSSHSDDPVLQLAAECSVPIDVDEDTFMISTREHLCAVHEIASLPLQKGDFDLALGIFYKLLKGLDLQPDFLFLKGTVLHNIGMLQLWQGEYQKALSSFARAVEDRIQHLPKNHPDIVVSMIRKGTALFALERHDEAVAVLEVALPLIPRDHIVKAKIRNNLGVVYYHQGDLALALKEFTRSLEIQRAWLDASARRETLVIDAATTMSNMGRLYLERADYDLACHVYEEALLLQTTLFAKDSDVVLASMTNLALAKAKSGHAKAALQILHGCVRSKNSRYGHGSPSSIETIGLMGHFFTKRKEFPDAMKCLKTVRKWQKANLPQDHPAHSLTRDLVGVIEEEIGKDASVWV